MHASHEIALDCTRMCKLFPIRIEHEYGKSYSPHKGLSQFCEIGSCENKLYELYKARTISYSCR